MGVLLPIPCGMDPAYTGMCNGPTFVSGMNCAIIDLSGGALPGRVNHATLNEPSFSRALW